jgi:hypothetical protein
MQPRTGMLNHTPLVSSPQSALAQGTPAGHRPVSVMALTFARVGNRGRRARQISPAKDERFGVRIRKAAQRRTATPDTRRPWSAVIKGALWGQVVLHNTCRVRKYMLPPLASRLLDWCPPPGARLSAQADLVSVGWDTLHMNPPPSVPQDPGEASHLSIPDHPADPDATHSPSLRAPNLRSPANPPLALRSSCWSPPDNASSTANDGLSCFWCLLRRLNRKISRRSVLEAAALLLNGC